MNSWNPPQYQPPPTYTPPPKLKLRPAAGWYGLVAIPTVVIPLIGVVLAISGVVSVFGALSDIRPVDASGVATVQLEQGETVGVYGTFYDRTASGYSGACEIRAPNGERVDIDGMGASSVTLNEWDALGSFTAPSAGTYTLQCANGSPGAFGPDPDVGGVFGAIVTIFALFVAGPVIGLVVFLVILAMRSRDKKRQMAAMHHPAY